MPKNTRSRNLEKTFKKLEHTQAEPHRRSGRADASVRGLQEAVHAAHLERAGASASEGGPQAHALPLGAAHPQVWCA